MAKSEQLKQKRAKQVAEAEAQFEVYKNFIAKEFIEKFGGSYQTAENMKDIWRDTFVFRPECEQFLISKTKLFIMLMGTPSSSAGPCFLRVITGKISEYLSRYICKKGISHNDCIQQLRDIFFVKNFHVEQEIKRYKSEENKAYAMNHKKKTSEAAKNGVNKTAVHKKCKQFIRVKIYVKEFSR